MQIVRLGDEVFEDFRVSDNYHIGVTGLNISNFEVKIYNNDGIDRSNVIPIDFQELGNGNYRIKYIPSESGTWCLYLRHTLYFPYGKANGINVVEYDLKDIGDMLKRILGLTQENYYVYDTVFDTNGNLTNSKISVYSDNSSVGTTNNIIANYNMITTYNNGNMETYKVVKV
jgi:hypothetical protein